VSESDWIDFVMLLLLFCCCGLLAYAAGRDVGDRAHADDFKRGWIAGIDYERQRRESL
jgi:hypothetical protein